ncbi:predicted protein [Plenodomus lingam JN3]|uniref:Predicted protein n=1 Tax=Leptosphaeria maculans (strain JN3 / isolate v23.1.3 / race Av1-4-5-6-7-8) TaxID=985895 RepID=E5A8Z8_LEPMJ|nr:predicted protein [Plenodomus lingam JN3]CBY00093.1 predicted protein [Plenodomus lingam JN3]
MPALVLYPVPVWHDMFASRQQSPCTATVVKWCATVVKDTSTRYCSSVRLDVPGASGIIPSVVACHMTMGLASGDLGFTPSG